MNLIAVDVGNTSTAVGLWSGGRVVGVSHWDGDAAGAFSAVDALCGRAAGGIAYLSVVPKMDGRWRAFARRRRLAFHQVTSGDFSVAGAKLGVTLHYPAPETIGADRLADAAGAVDRYGTPLIVCDFGTAFTAAVITGDKVWRGGAIAPGFPLMSEYLFERTAKLPRMKIGGRCPRIGRSTEEAMRFGALVGYRGMVREIVSELGRNFGGKFRLVATGGFAKWVLKDSGMEFTIDPTLTLYGAGLIASRIERTKGKV